MDKAVDALLAEMEAGEGGNAAEAGARPPGR
jgi:hypothetical protein